VHETGQFLPFTAHFFVRCARYVRAKLAAAGESRAKAARKARRSSYFGPFGAWAENFVIQMA
jgi:hypothetical protein